jgi:hypothetical protein
MAMKRDTPNIDDVRVASPTANNESAEVIAAAAKDVPSWSDTPAAPTTPRAVQFARCPVCDNMAVVRLRDDWQKQNRSMPIIACGNPWHYATRSLGDAPEAHSTPAEALTPEQLDRALTASGFPPTPADALDVERLADALEAELPLNPGPYEKFAEGVREGMYRSLAERIAARLRSPESDR